MHMSDALISPAVGISFWAAAFGAVSYSVKKLKESMDERLIPLMGVLGAFVFAAQMINFIIPGTGSSGHLGGGMVLAIILGPFAGFLVIASVLMVQALFFADGGILALGCNIWNLGIYPCLVAYPLIYKPIVRSGNRPKSVTVAAVASSVIGLQLGALSVVMQTLFSGLSELPFRAFALVMQPLHLGIGVVEGVITAGIISFVGSARPEILECAASARPLAPGRSLRSVFTAFLAAALVTGGILSWYASSSPDGLEWSIEKVSGRPELPEPDSGMAPALKSLQEKTALLPDYGFRKPDEAPTDLAPGGKDLSRTVADGGKSLAGVIGSLLVLGLILMLGVGLRIMQKRHRP